jgi:hypothetical protein
MNRPVLLLAVVIVFVTGCATPYQPKGSSGGFSEIQLAPDSFVVTFAGNEHTSAEQVRDFALLRAAEVVLANNLPYFAIVDAAGLGTSNAYVAPGTSYTSGIATTVGNLTTYTATTTTTPAQTYNTFSPGLGLMVRGLKYPSEHAQAIDAALIVSTMKSKYKIN